MSMTKKLWSLSALAVEFNMDRRAVARRIDGIAPAGKLRKADAWHLADVTPALLNFASAEADAETIEEAKRRRAVAEARLAEMQADKQAGNLLDRETVDEAVMGAFARVRARLLAVPHKVAPLVAGQDTPTAYEEIRKAIWEALQELSETTAEDMTGQPPEVEDQ